MPAMATPRWPIAASAIVIAGAGNWEGGIALARQRSRSTIAGVSPVAARRRAPSNRPLNQSRRRDIVVSSRSRERAAGPQVNGKAFDERGLVIGTAAEGAQLVAGEGADEVPRRDSCHLGGATNACVGGHEQTDATCWAKSPGVKVPSPEAHGVESTGVVRSRRRTCRCR
jgi:hypothetical protein